MKTTAAAIAATTLAVGTIVAPAPTPAPTADAVPACYSGTVTKKEYVQIRRGMSKKRVQKRLWHAKGCIAVLHQIEGRRAITFTYRPSKRWHPASTVAVTYVLIDGRWRVHDAAANYILRPTVAV